MELFPHPLKIRVLIRNQRFERRTEQFIVFLERLQNRAGRKVQLGQPPAVILHLLDELERWLPVRQDARRRARRDGGERGSLLRLKLQSAQAVQKPAINFVRMRKQQPRQAV